MATASLKSRRTAFTLVELLVVIGIIAVLIGILLPALNRARKQARVVECASLMRQVALATRNYAVDNRDSIPPMPLDNGQANFSVTDKIVATTTILTARAFTNPYFTYSGVDPATNMQGAGIGRLVIKGYMKGDMAKLTTCPEAASSDIGGWGVYHYNVHMAYRTIPGDANWYMQPWWKKISKYGKVKGDYTAAQAITPYATLTGYSYPSKKWALLTDALLMPSTGATKGFLAHQVGSNYVFNLAFADGSVQSVSLPVSKSRGNSVNYGQILDMLSYLEIAAEGGGADNKFPNNPATCIPLNP